MSKVKKILFVGFFSLSALSSQAALPPDAVAMLNTFPGKSISLELVLSRAIQSSDSYRALESSLTAIEVPYLQSLAALDTNLTFSGNYLNDSNESSNSSKSV